MSSNRSFELGRLREAYLAAFVDRRDDLVRAAEALAAGAPGAEQDLDRQLHNLIGSGGSHAVPQVSDWARSLRTAVAGDETPAAKAELVLSSLTSLDAQIAAATAQPAGFEPLFAPREERATVLLVEDDPDMRMLIESLLDVAGYDTEAAPTAAAARAAIDTAKPSLVLLNINLPDANGHDLFREMRADGRLSFVPIIFLSTKASASEVAAGFRLGADDFISKPFEAESFLARVVARLTRARALAEEAVRDPLTGLYNRRIVGDMMVREFSNARRRKEPLTVALCDLDNFKNWNDTYGHAAGDDVLRRFAAALNGGVRIVDTACRWGGEEFLILLPRCDSGGATKVMARVRWLFAAAQGKGPRITFSAGVATLRDGDDPAKLVARADEALYRAKREGKDRVVAG